jgi:hypothetical protein
MLFNSQEVSTSTSEMSNIVQAPQINRYGYKNLTCIFHPNCASTCTFMQKKMIQNYHSHYFFCSKNVTRYKLIPPNILSIEGLNSRRTGQVFVEDIMVVYSTYLDKEKKTRCIMHVDMTKNEAMMNVTPLAL